MFEAEVDSWRFDSPESCFCRKLIRRRFDSCPSSRFAGLCLSLTLIRGDLIVPNRVFAASRFAGDSMVSGVVLSPACVLIRSSFTGDLKVSNCVLAGSCYAGDWIVAGVIVSSA